MALEVKRDLFVTDFQAVQNVHLQVTYLRLGLPRRSYIVMDGVLVQDGEDSDLHCGLHVGA